MTIPHNMCGITGLTGYNQHKAEALMQRMLKLQQHRGPDATGMWQDDLCTLGHNRLSIIDTSEVANQPMQSHNGRFVMVYNGEIYNYREIKARLKDRIWKTHSDTEVLLEAWAEWGADCLNQLNGMFSIAMWDTQEKALHLIRDRLGIKPLYYTIKDNNILFASELRTLLHSGEVADEINMEAVAQFLQFQWIQTPQTIMQYIRQLPAGSHAIWKDRELKVQLWWDINRFTSGNEQASDITNIQKSIKELFFASVERRLISDVPLGAFLSGGIDSSAVVAAMATCSSQEVNTFSIGFKEKQWDESPYAQTVARKYRTKHHTLTYSGEELLLDIPGILASFDTPSTDGVNTWVISKKVKEAGITVALSGLGGDELFCGYPVFTQLPDLLQKNWLWHIPFRNTLAGELHKSANPQRKKAGLMLLEKPAKENLYPFFREIQPRSALGEIINDYKSETKVFPVEYPADEQLLNWISKTEISGYTRHVLLKDADMCSMHHALEIRVPFFDYTLVEFVLQVQDKFKKPLSPKKLFIDAMGDLLPDSVVNRPKMGFAFPWDVWLRGPLKPFAEKNLQAAAHYPFLHHQAIWQLWQQFLQGNKAIKWYRIWNLICLINWLETNLWKEKN